MDAILEAAARVFRWHGARATTNQVARAAGVGIGSLYEYFPDKQALLAALAERHVALAESEVGAALAHAAGLEPLLRQLQRALLESQRFPSLALELLAPGSREPLAERASALRRRVLDAIAGELERCGLESVLARLRARAVLLVIGDLTLYASVREPDQYAALGAELLSMALRHCRD